LTAVAEKRRDLGRCCGNLTNGAIEAARAAAGRRSNRTEMIGNSLFATIQMTEKIGNSLFATIERNALHDAVPNL